MSRAFVKEDVDPPERSGKMRSASGLPPGAANYVTAEGARGLREKLARIRASGADQEQAAELEQLLASMTIVSAPDSVDGIAFGAKVTVRNAAGQLKAYRIVGVDELNLHQDAVSWISPVGRALLAAEIGNKLTLEDEQVKIVKVEYPVDQALPPKVT